MLFIKSLRLTNFGRHKHLKATIDGHVAGLTGSNGKGKTTVLQALQFALTGTIDHPDPLNAFIRRESGESPPKFAEVEVEFTADGKEGRIVRRVTRTTITRSLWWDGCKEPITADKKVAAILFDILGVDKNAINSTVFIRQGEMASMFGKDTDRRGFYTRLLMLGHLEKIGKQIDVYRETVAASVQDLGVARDAAETTYREAEDYFNVCDRVAASAKSPAADIASLRVAKVKLSRHEEAHHAWVRAKSAVALQLDDGEDETELLETLSSSLDGRRASKERLVKMMGDHIAASSAWAAADAARSKMQEALGKLEELEKLREALARVEKDATADPTGEIRSLEKALEDFQRLATAADSIPGLQESLSRATAELKEAEIQLADEQKVYDAARADYGRLHDMHEMRVGILKELKGARLEGQPCLVCGSADPSRQYLEDTIARSKNDLDALEVSGKESGERMRTYKERWSNADRQHLKAVGELAEAEKTEARLRVELALRDRGETERSLDAARLALEAFLTSRNERVRLSSEINRLEGAVALLGYPFPPGEYEAIAVRVKLAEAALAAHPWNPNLEKEIADTDAEIGMLTARKDLLQKVSDDLTRAQRDMETAWAELSVAVEATKAALPGATGTITEADVTARLEVLEMAQQEFDEARGRRDGAMESMRKASARLTELETRAAEQVVRLNLVKDLEALRDTFKPNGASMDYLDYKFGKIAELAGDYLAESGADFMVAPSEELPLSYDFLRTDREGEVWMGQSRTSGGQKVRLAVATLRAIHAMVMPNVGLLVLDEPTTHLDEDAKRSMADMLQKIGDEGNLQMIVCDHSPTLIEAFSDAIEIPE